MSRRAKPRKSAARFERLEERLAMSVEPTVDVAAPLQATALLPKIQVSHFGQDIAFIDATGGIQAILVTNQGSGYSRTTPPTVTITGGGGSGATARAIVGASGSANSGRLIGIEVTNVGTGYTSAPTVTITGGGGSGATAEATFYATGEEKFAAWAQDYVTFVTNSGASVCYINIGDFRADTKGYYSYLDPAKGDATKGNSGVPWIVTYLLDKLPAGVEVGAIAYLDVANPWTIYDPNNFAANNLTTDGLTGSPPKNNMYQSFQMVNAINAVQLQKGGTKFITHYQADGEGAGAFETDTYYGFGGAPAAAGDLYDPNTAHQTQRDTSWSWTPGPTSAGTNNGWPVAGYGYTKWLWNHFMPGTTAPAPGGAHLPAGGSMPDLTFTDQEATDPATWSSAQGHGYQFGIIKYAQTSWLQYSPGPMVAYTENYWFGENHYLPGPGSAILPDGMMNIDGVNTPILNKPTTTAVFSSGTPQVTFNTPTIDGTPTGTAIGTAAQGYAVMGSGAIDTDAVGSASHTFFGAGIGQGYSTGAWVTSGGSGYTQGDKYNLNVTFSPPPAGPGARQATGFIGAVSGSGAVQGIVVIDPGAGYVTEPTITFSGSGTGAQAVALLLPEHGYPTITFPAPPAGPNARQATGYLTVNSQSNKPGSITGIVILDAGAGYAYAPQSSTDPNPLAGDHGGLPLTISSTPAPAPYLQQILQAAGAPAAAPCPSIYVPVNSSPSQIDHIVLTVLGDHYDATLNKPSYTIAGDTSRASYPLHIDPRYNAAYAPVFNKAGAFPVDGTGLSSVTVITRGSGYSAGAVITNQGGGYDKETLYPVTFSPPTGPDARTATGFLNIDANGCAIGITITDPGEGYVTEPTITIPGPGANVHGGTTAQATAHLLNYPRVTMTGGTFKGGVGTPAVPYVITGPADKNNPGDPDTSYVVTGIGFTNPGLGYDGTQPPPQFTISAPTAGATATVQALPGLATKYSAYSLQPLPVVRGGPAAPDFKGPIQGGGNAYNWQISNGYGSGQVTGVTISAQGSGYSASNPPTVTFSAPQPGGVAAEGTAVVNASGAVTGIKITNHNYGYLAPPTVTIGPPASGSTATATATIGDIQELSGTALNTVYDYYADFPQQLALMFDDENYQDVSLPKLREDFYHPLSYADWVVPQAGDQASIDKWTNVIDGTKVGQSAIATFSIESLNRSNFGAATCLDAKYQDPRSLAVANTYGGTFAGLSSLTWENFVGFLNFAAQRIASQSVRQGVPMRASDVTFQVYDVAFLPLEWLQGQSANRWSNVNETPVLLPGSGGSVAENAPPHTVIYTAEATDIGATVADRTVTFALEPGVGDEGLLTIDPHTGEVRLRQAADYESKRSYAFTVVATDGGSPALSASRAVTVTVLDLAEPPALPRLNAPATFTIPEDTRTPLVFPQPPFTGTPPTTRTRYTAILSVADGAVRAASGAGIVVGGTPTARTFTGTLPALNAFFTASPGRILYAPAANNAAGRTLAIRLETAAPAGVVLDRAASLLDVVPVDDAPRVAAPRGFAVNEDVASPLVWPAAARIVQDIDSPRVTVTLGVPAGVLRALPGPAVTVGGTESALTVSGAPAALAAYFRTLGNVTYTTAPHDTSRQVLTVTAADDHHVSSVAATIRVRAAHDRPSIAPPLMFRGTLNAAAALVFTGTPFADPDAAAAPGRQYTVTLRVQDGRIEAASGSGVVVAGRGTSRTFRGTLSDLNAFFTASPGLVTYGPVTGNTAQRTLAIRIAKTVSGPNGSRVLAGSGESLIAIGPI